MDDSDLRTILSEGGIPIVDVVLYLIPHTGLKDEDIQCIKSLEDKTNVVALLARSDELDSSTISASKQRIRQQISQHGLDCFSFATPDLASDITDIFSVSSATATDYSIMDASTLMNSCYMQPLILTDLSRLVEHLFSSDGCAWLRHSAAAKCIEWRRSQDRGFHLDMALTRRDPTDYALSSILTTNPFVPRQLWGRVELSNWAQCLRDSLHSEQTQHQSEQRAIVEMYARQLSDQDLLRLRGGGVACVNSRMGVKRGSTRPFTHQDPLGILEVGSHLKRNGQWTFELMGSMGVLGCMAAFLAGPDSWMCPRVLRELTRDVFNWSLV